MITKSIKHLFIACSLCCSGAAIFTSCEDMFDTESDRQIFDPALDQKTDSMFYTLGILKGLQQLADQYVMTGEMRGDLTDVNQYTELDLQQLANFTADASNKYDSAYIYYRVINNCNYYLAHRDTTLRTGSRPVAIAEYAEALAVRAWAYLQLCKNYGEVPFYTDPLVSIGQANSQVQTKDLRGICDALTPELIKFSGTAVPDYGETSAGVLNSSDSENPQEKKVQTRLAMIPVDVVLGDLFLETNQYEQAARYYFNYLRVKEMPMLEARAWPTETFIEALLEDKMPSSMTFISNTSSSFEWSSIFSVTSTNDIITYIPMAANRLRGAVTELPRYFGYDFYSTTGGSASSNARYLLERQINPSAAYLALSESQEFYYTPTAATGGSTVVKVAELGDMRRFYTMRQVSRDDSTFAVMTKFNSANIPIYRTATVYLRLAEAINRMGYPDAAFAILKDGINQDLLTYVMRGDSLDREAGRYIRPETEQMLRAAVPFLSAENVNAFEDNVGIHSRGTYFTQGSFSPYQYHAIVGRKLVEIAAKGSPVGATMADTINAVEDLICDEMALELAYEGSRFGDLTRIARHKNAAALYGADSGSRWLADKLAFKRPAVSLLDERNWYLPFK